MKNIILCTTKQDKLADNEYSWRRATRRSLRCLISVFAWHITTIRASRSKKFSGSSLEKRLLNLALRDATWTPSSQEKRQEEETTYAADTEYAD